MVRFSEDYTPNETSSVFNISSVEMCLIYKSLFHYCKQRIEIVNKMQSTQETIEATLELEGYVDLLQKVKKELRKAGLPVE